MKIKSLLLAACFLTLISLTGCSANPATGRTQFAALMSPAQEQQVGASEHQKIQQQFGFYENAALQSYVDSIGRRVSAETERTDVQYKFFILDSPIVNAFALPGGYIYVSRGLLALANSEAELAAVLAHETGHITGRHSAERYSRGVVTSLGAAVLSAALDSQGASEALGLGSNLYMSSYSRSQENEADTLGLRYMARGGYSVDAMSRFLSALQAESRLQAQMQGRNQGPEASYFSTHPATGERVAKTQGEASQYPAGGDVGRERHLQMIEGMTFGDSARHGFVRGGRFYHPAIGFTFDVPQGFRVMNQPSEVVAVSQDGTAMIFDMVGGQGTTDPASYITSTWIKDGRAADLERVEIGGMQAATASFQGAVNGQQMVIRVLAIHWGDGRFARFQIGMPPRITSGTLDSLKQSTYSFRRLSESEASTLRPHRIKTVVAGAGDTVQSLAARQSMEDLPLEHFVVLNGLAPGQEVQAGQAYKLIVD